MNTTFCHEGREKSREVISRQSAFTYTTNKAKHFLLKKFNMTTYADMCAKTILMCDNSLRREKRKSFYIRIYISVEAEDEECLCAQNFFSPSTL